MEFSYEDVQNILRIIDGSSLEELHLEIGDFKLIVRKKGVSASPVGEPVSGSDDGSKAALPDARVPIQVEGGAESVTDHEMSGAILSGREVPSQLVREGCFEVKAPTVGTFYRAAAPGASPFVEVGSEVGENDTVCIIEVMKLMNSIKARWKGRVVEICAENGAMVEFGQTLMVIERLP